MGTGFGSRLRKYARVNRKNGIIGLVNTARNMSALLPVCQTGPTLVEAESLNTEAFHDVN